MLAVKEEHTDTVELLLSSGADVNAKDKKGKLSKVIGNIIFKSIKFNTLILFLLTRKDQSFLQ